MVDQSNSNEKLACGGIEMFLPLLELVENDFVSNINTTSVRLERVGKQIELQRKINPSADKDIYKMMSMHDKVVGDFLMKLKKYGKPKQR